MQVAEKFLTAEEHRPLELRRAEPPGVQDSRGSDSIVLAQETRLHGDVTTCTREPLELERTKSPATGNCI